MNDGAMRWSCVWRKKEVYEVNGVFVVVNKHVDCLHLLLSAGGEIHVTGVPDWTHKALAVSEYSPQSPKALYLDHTHIVTLIHIGMLTVTLGDPACIQLLNAYKSGTIPRRQRRQPTTPTARPPTLPTEAPHTPTPPTPPTLSQDPALYDAAMQGDPDAQLCLGLRMLVSVARVCCVQ